MTKPLRVAMIAPPWLSIPPVGYGGIELVLQGLVNELVKKGLSVEFFSIGDSRLKGVKTQFYYPTEQYHHIHKPLYESAPIAITQIMYALNKIAQDGKFDIIHDHNGFLGPLVLSWATKLPNMPPALHTHHGPPFSSKEAVSRGEPDNVPMWKQFCASNRLYFVGISDSLMEKAPRELKPHMLPAVHNAIEVEKFPFTGKKKPYFFTLARFSKEKGQHLAAELCSELKYRLEMAGTVAGINTPKDLFLELSNPLSEFRNFADFRYYSDKVWPITVKNPRIRFIGNVRGRRKVRLMSEAKALLFPIDWEEPFGMAVIETLATGTPVIAMKRGSMPEIIEHGVNGFLAKSPTEFKQYMQKIDQIDPTACRKSVIKRFSAPIMAKNYINRYNQVLELDKI